MSYNDPQYVQSTTKAAKNHSEPPLPARSNNKPQRATVTYNVTITHNEPQGATVSHNQVQRTTKNQKESQ